MLAAKLTLLLAAAGQATAVFAIGHRAVHSYAETDNTARLKHDNSASQGKLVVATRTLGDLTYTYLSPEFTAESATNGIGEATPLASSTTSATTETETQHRVRTRTITRTVMAKPTQPAHTLPALETGDLPFHVHGGGDYTSITFFGGYGTPTTSTALSTSTTVAPYAHSIGTTQDHSISVTEPTTAPVTASTSSITSSEASEASSSLSIVVPTSTSSSYWSFSSSHSTTSSSLVSLSSSAHSATSTETGSATTLSGLTVPAGSATATTSPNAAETHGYSAGCRAEAAVSPMVLSMVLVYIFVL